MTENRLIAIGGLLGIAALIWKRSPYAFPAAAYPVVFPWLYYVMHSKLKYRHPIDLVVLLLVAIAGGRLVRKSSARRVEQWSRPCSSSKAW